MSDEQTRFELEEAGKAVGRYRLAYEIASGGQASIFMAVSDGPSGFGKVVALKRLHKHLAKDPQFVSMVLDEARLAAQLTHPNVCGVIDFGVADDEYFMAMEYLTGVTVAKLASDAQRLEREGKLDRKRWTGLVGLVIAAAAEGLRAAHELRDARGDKLNVVHRDVSPQNIMVGFDGSVRVMDFGIAKYDDRETETTLGEVKGKYAYMSPEQARAQPIDQRTDVWALAVIGWELLTLKRLFKRDTTAHTVLAVVSDPVDPVSSLVPGLDAEVDLVFGRALERDREARTNDARAFASALRRALGGELDASDLATWVQQSFPEAEIKARTMVDLARQSARGVPSIAKRATEASSSTSTIRAPIHVAAEPSAVTLVPPAPSRWPMAVGVLVVLAVGGGVIGTMLGPSEPPSAPVAALTPDAGAPVDAAALPDAITPIPDAATIEPDAGSPASPVDATARRVVRATPQPPVTPPEPPVTPPQPPVTPPPTSAPPATVAAPTTGTIVVVTPGTWANVFGPSGEAWGTTPLRRSVPAGPITIELRIEGQPPARRESVEVPAGGIGRVTVRP